MASCPLPPSLTIVEVAMTCTCPCNVGKTERTVRFVIGTVLFLMGFFLPDIDTVWRVVLVVIAAVALVTAAMRYCPANALFGFNTCERKDKGQE